MAASSLNNFSDVLAGLKRQIQGSRFLRWWLGELAAMVPAWMRSSDLTREHYVALGLDQIHAHMRKPEVGRAQALAITLNARQVLRKTISLPLATEENLRQVLEFQMEQHTPFPSAKVYFAYIVRSRDFSTGLLTVELVAAPRDAVDSAIQTVSALGVEARAVFVGDLLSAGTMLNLLPAAQGSAPSPLRHGANPWLAALVAVLALAALALPLVIKREAVVQLLPYVDKGKRAAEAVNNVRHDLDVRVEQHNYLLEKRQKSPPVIQMLEEVTHLLPDDTWVQVFEVKGKELQLQGETASSSRLIGLFEQSHLFQDASFRSPLFKGQAAGTERYQLAIQLRPPAKPASSPSAAASAPKLGASAVAASASTPVNAASASASPAKAASSASQPAGGKKP